MSSILMKVLEYKPKQKRGQDGPKILNISSKSIKIEQFSASILTISHNPIISLSFIKLHFQMILPEPAQNAKFRIKRY